MDKDLKLSSQSDHRIEISGNIFIRDTLAQSSEVAISGLLVCACAVSLEPNFSYHMGVKKYSPSEKQILDIKPCCTRQYVDKTFSLLMKTCMRCLLFLRSFNLVLEYEKIIYFCFPFHTSWSACSPYIPVSEVSLKEC